MFVKTVGAHHTLGTRFKRSSPIAIDIVPKTIFLALGILYAH